MGSTSLHIILSEGSQMYHFYHYIFVRQFGLMGRGVKTLPEAFGLVGGGGEDNGTVESPDNGAGEGTAA